MNHIPVATCAGIRTLMEEQFAPYWTGEIFNE
jgi:hypothetical protein